MNTRTELDAFGSDPEVAHLRIPPHSIEAETSVLGALLMDNGAFDSVGDVLAPRTVLVAMGWLLGLFLVAGTLHVLHRRYVGDPHRLLEKIRVVVTATTPQQLTPRGTAEMQAMARAVNELAAQRDQLRGDVAEQVAQASHSVQQEKNRLAALMAELNQSVVVCNREGRILLYNQRARQQFRQLSQGAGAAAGAELIGIGRSIYAVLDQQLVAHALERIHQALGRGVATPSAQFVTTTQGGHLLRVQVAPVRESVPPGEGETQEGLQTVSGLVLMLDDVTASVQEEAERDQLMHGLTEGSRASLANIQAAVDMLGYADLEPAMRERFLGVVRDEVGAMGRRVNDLAHRATQRLKTRWPMEDMLGADLVTAAQRRVAQHCDRPVTLDTIDTSLWLKVDSYTLLLALTYLAHRLVDEFEVRFLQLRLQGTATHAQLDLVWRGQAMSNDEEVPRAQLPFEFMLNALRLREGFTSGLFAARTGVHLDALPGYAQALSRGLLEVTGDQVRATELGWRFLNDTVELFLP